MKDIRLDIVMPVTDSSIDMLAYTIPNIKKYLPVKQIVLIGRRELVIKVEALFIDNLVFIDEDELICGMTLQNIKTIKQEISGNDRRSGWYFQQLLKMGYALVCKDDYYLIWDSDTIPVRKLNFFADDDRPYLDYLPYTKSDEPYLANIKRTLNIEDLNYYSYITEHMLISKKIMLELLDAFQSNTSIKGKSFYEKIMYSVDEKEINLSGFSEFETYAIFMMNYFPESFVLRKWNNLRSGKIYFGDKPNERQLQWVAEEFSVVSIEHFHSQWKICKLLLTEKYMDKHSFKKFYSIINVLVKIQTFVRGKLRIIVKR